MRLPRRLAALALTLLLLTGPSAATGAVPAPVPDLSAARRVFEANLDAIRRRDREAYLACYLQSPNLARTGPTGFSLGYDELARTTGSGWPDHFEGLDLHLTPVRPGLVYGTYRYRVRYGAEEQRGISERFFLETQAGWKIAVSTAFQATPGVPPPPRAIVGATLVDGTGRPPVRDAVVVFRDGRIEAAGPRSRVPVPAGVDTLDARGGWLLPGLVDAHVHYSQTGWADGRPDALDLRPLHPYAATVTRLREHPERFHRAWLANGVTAVFDVGGYAWTIAMARAAEDDFEAPHVAAAGPLLSTIDHWLNLPAERQFMVLRDTASTAESVRYLKSLGAAAVKVWFIVTPTTDFEAMSDAVVTAGREARRQKLPLIVHATGLREAKVALRAGAALLVHSVDDLAVDADFLSLARKAGTIYCPTLTVRGGYVRMAEAVTSGRPPALDDPHHSVDSLTLARIGGTAGDARRLGIPGRIYRASRLDSMNTTMARNLMAVHRAGIPIAMGTDAGNPLTLHGPAVYAEMEAMQKAGLSPMDVIVASTRNGARAMGRGRDLGTIEKGKAADLILVNSDPTRDVRALRDLRWVARGGVIRSSEEMRAAIARAH